MRGVNDAGAASKQLVDYALNRFSTDNLSCMIVRLDHSKESQVEAESAAIQASEADKIVEETKQKIADGSAPAEGVSPSNNAPGKDSTIAIREGEFVPTSLDEAVEEEPEAIHVPKTTQDVPVLNKQAVEDARKDKPAE